MDSAQAVLGRALELERPGPCLLSREYRLPVGGSVGLRLPFSIRSEYLVGEPLLLVGHRVVQLLESANELLHMSCMLRCIGGRPRRRHDPWGLRMGAVGYGSANWELPVPFQASSANSPKRSYNHSRGRRPPIPKRSGSS